MLTSRGLHRVLGDLAEMGFDARWGVLGAVDAGAPHKRERIWILAHAHGRRLGAAGGRKMEQQGGAEVVCGSDAPDAGAPHKRERIWVMATDADLWNGEDGGRLHAGLHRQAKGARPERSSRGRSGRNGGAWDAQPDVGRVAHGVASRVDRLRALGNGQVPQVAALAWEILR